VTFLGFVEKSSKNVEMSQMTQIRSLYMALFRRSASIYVSKLRVAVGQIHNLETGHVYVLGLKSGSERQLPQKVAPIDRPIGSGLAA